MGLPRICSCYVLLLHPPPRKRPAASRTGDLVIDEVPLPTPLRQHFEHLFRGLQFRALRDVKREAVEAWLTRGEKAGRSARTRNTYLAACKWFLNFCVDTERLIANPLARIPAADEQADRQARFRRCPRNGK